MISLLLLKLLRIEKIYQEFIQSSALFDGFILCIFIFGLAILATELFAYWITHNPLFGFLLKFYYILSLLFVTGLPFTVLLTCLVCCGGDQVRGQKCMLCAVMLLMFICCFAVQWTIISSFATLLLSLAYPLHVTTLAVLHFAFVFALSVTLGVFVSETTSNQKDCTFNCTCACIGALVIAILLYITIILGYASTIVQRIVPADGGIHSLLFLPSVILLLIGWLLKKRYFGM